MNCVVVIPLYKAFGLLLDSEKKSLIQCFNVLNPFPIAFIGPEHLDFKPYLDIAGKYGIHTCVKYFSDNYFSSVGGYNSLLMSHSFYKSFLKYKFLLIYQLDAFVFRNELEYWCNKGYDYIGAPWFEGWHNAKRSSGFIGAGNGGFSLRNVHKSISIVKRVAILRWLQQECKKFSNDRFSAFIFLVNLFNHYFRIKNKQKLYYLDELDKTNEDVCWARKFEAIFSDLHVAPAEIAGKFSFDANPSYLYEINNRQLPFGCHAWEKYEPEFWRDHIESNA